VDYGSPNTASIIRAATQPCAGKAQSHLLEKALVIGRKNYLFVGSQTDGKAAALGFLLGVATEASSSSSDR
jgi:hypothetical protein